MVLDIIIEEVIGWNIKKGTAREDVPGLFGVPQAFTAMIEEQGCRTLHTHIQVWLKDFNQWVAAVPEGISNLVKLLLMSAMYLVTAPATNLW